jgi:large subunit ribosomal protein L17
MLRTMVTQFLDKERIVTTVPKAKELRPYAERMITLGKRESLHARRQALSLIRRKDVVAKLFDDLALRYSTRNGGYTRIIRLGRRKGDGSELAMVELVGTESEAPEKKEKSTKKKSAPKKEAAPKKKPPAKKPAKKKAEVEAEATEE